MGDDFNGKLIDEVGDYLQRSWQMAEDGTSEKERMKFVEDTRCQWMKDFKEKTSYIRKNMSIAFQGGDQNTDKKGGDQNTDKKRGDQNTDKKGGDQITDKRGGNKTDKQKNHILEKKEHHV